MSGYLLILLMSLFSVVFAQQTPTVPTDTDTDNKNSNSTRTIIVVMIVIGSLILASCIWDIVRRVKIMRKKMMAQNEIDVAVSENKMTDNNPTQSPPPPQQKQDEEHRFGYYS